MYEYFDDLGGEVLEHYGVLGMKWGVRRYQNYDGSLIHPKGGRSKARGGLSKAINKFKTNRSKARVKKVKERAQKQASKQLEREEKLEEKKAKAIANVDIDTIIKMKGQMTTAELQDARTRALAIKQINDSRLPKPKSTVEKLVDKLDVGKKTLDSIKNFHASVRGLGEEIGVVKKKETSDQNDKKKKNQQDQKKKDSTVPDKIGERLSNLEKRISDLNGQSKGEKRSGESKKKGRLDIWENEDSEWTPPSFTKRTRMSDIPKASQNRESFVSRLSRVGQIFKDTTPYEPSAREKNDSWINKLSSVSRDMSIERVKKRNESGWTAKNNDEWLSVLSDAANIHVGDGEWNKYYKYK